MSAAPFQHVAISASAGSGKTFQLAYRYLALLASGVPPDRITALTFSRKAAGEIFDAVADYLCEAAGSEAGAELARGRIGRPDITRADFATALRNLVRHLPRLRIGTLDSFIVSVLRAFPHELGIPPEFQLIDEQDSAGLELRDRILDTLFAPDTGDDADRHTFFEAFKQATFGLEPKFMENDLYRFIQSYRKAFQRVPDPRAWGQPEAIWPSGSPWLADNSDPAEAAAQLIAALDSRATPTPIDAKLRMLAEVGGNAAPGAPWPTGLEKQTVFLRLLESVAALRRGDAEIAFNRQTYPLTPQTCAWLLALLQALIGRELRTALQRTAGLYRILERYEARYETFLRAGGLLTFADAQYLLSANNPYGPGAVLSRRANVEQRLYIDYRLDARLDHWLLDEFQDTNDLQWNVLKNLVDEIVQDNSGTRSFFYVGDVKQAIYQWRGGNPRLFRDVLDTYGNAIVCEPLAASYRSGPAIIETVNRVFDSLPEDTLPEQAMRAWDAVWQPHTCSEHTATLSGYAALVEPVADPGEGKPTEADRLGVVAALVRRIDPARRGLSLAVLVRRNATGREVVERLRADCPGIPIAHEGKGTPRDNPAVEALLALLRLAAHPGDTFAWQHVRMSPLGPVLDTLRLERDTLSLSLLGAIHRDGYETFVRHWGDHLNQAATLDAFGLRRLKDLAAAAIAFDRDGGGDIDAFLRFITSFQIEDPVDSGAVRVMTVHAAKGLGFDVVILPELMGNTMARTRELDIAVHAETEAGKPPWALAMPRRLVAEADPVLATEVRDQDAQAAFDALCVLYVGMTRPKRALYMVSSDPGPTARALNPAAFLKQQLVRGEPRLEPGALGDPTLAWLYEAGERDWYQPLQKTRSDRATVQPPPWPQRPFRGRTLLRLEPSTEQTTPRRAAWLFDEAAREVLDFGSLVHALFQQVAWLDTCDIEAIIADTADRFALPTAVRRDAVAQFRRAMAMDAIRRLLTQPPEPVVLWREKRFEWIQDGRLVSGMFDRVHIRTGANGQPCGAHIIDYKSDRIGDAGDLSAAVERHRGQLARYHAALTAMLRLDPSVVRAGLVFTRRGDYVAVPV